MALPPGREPIPVAGIDPATNPKLAEAAGELNAWIDYLLHPESNDGPRIYRPRNPGMPDTPDDKDFETHQRMPPADRDAPYEDPEKYETLSVLTDFAGDTSVFFKAAQAVCGIESEVIAPTYDKLTKGCMTWYSPDDATAPVEEENEEKRDPVHARYPAVHPALANWEHMRKTWTSPNDISARAYETDLVNYQLLTENAVYTVAEHMVRYRGILHKAGEDIFELMRAMADKCPKPSPPGEGAFNLFSVVVTGLVGAATTVISGGTGTTVGVVLGVAVAEMLGEGVKTAEQKGEKNEPKLESHYHLRDTVSQYLEAVDKIESDTARALQDLRDNLRRELDHIRRSREYVNKPGTGSTAKVPLFSDYL